jgi:hypothetical protein
MLSQKLGSACSMLDRTSMLSAAFEIGNEPDFYNSLTLTNFTIHDYVTRWLDYSTVVQQHVLQENPYGLNQNTLFQAGAFALATEFRSKK